MSWLRSESEDEVARAKLSRDRVVRVPRAGRVFLIDHLFGPKSCSVPQILPIFVVVYIRAAVSRNFFLFFTQPVSRLCLITVQTRKIVQWVPDIWCTVLSSENAPYKQKKTMYQEIL